MTSAPIRCILKTILPHKTREEIKKKIYSRSKGTQNDLENYLSTSIKDIDECLLTYWKRKAHKWPKLALMARDFLAIPSTSAASERSFSVGRDMLGLSRHSMKPSTMEATMCLRSWHQSGIVFD